MRRSAIIALVALGSLTGPFAVGQGRRGGMAQGRRASHVERSAKPATPLDEFERMTPEERRNALDKLPPDRRKKVQQQLDRLNRLTPEQREKLKEQYEMFRQLPPERQEALRKVMKRFSEQPPERRQALRDELIQLRSMGESERRARLASPDTRSRFNSGERKILEEMSSFD
jgi:hypothetical protein